MSITGGRASLTIGCLSYDRNNEDKYKCVVDYSDAGITLQSDAALVHVKGWLYLGLIFGLVDGVPKNIAYFITSKELFRIYK